MYIHIKYIQQKFFLFLLFCSAFFLSGALSKKEQANIYVTPPITMDVGVDFLPLRFLFLKDPQRTFSQNQQYVCSLQIAKMMVAAHYGQADIIRDYKKSEGSLSVTKGHYIRIGGYINFLPYTFYRHQFFVGIESSFSSMQSSLESTKWRCMHPSESCDPVICKPLPLSLQRLKDRKASLSWYTWVVGIKTHLVGPLYGATYVRLHFHKKDHEFVDLIPFDVPGFGINQPTPVFGMSSYLILSIPLKKIDIRKSRQRK